MNERTGDRDTQFSDLITKAVAERMQPDFIEKAVLERVDKLIIGAIDDALRSFSDTGKLIKSAVQTALQVDNIDLPTYGETVTKILKVQIEAQVAELVAGRLTKDMETLLSLAPKASSLSKIAEWAIEHSCDEDAFGECITVISEQTDYGSWWVYIDERSVYEEHEKHQCDIRLLISQDGTIASATFSGKPMKDTRQLGTGYGLEQLLRAYYAVGTVIEMDVDDVVTGKGDY